MAQELGTGPSDRPFPTVIAMTTKLSLPRSIENPVPVHEGLTAPLLLASLAAASLAGCGGQPAVEASASEAMTLDTRLVSYTAAGELSGVIRSVGSDTLLNTVTLWSRAFGARYPEVQFEIDGRGSATGPPALLAGDADIAPMSRAMDEKEIAAFTARHGYPPLGICFGVDGLGVFVHKDNPIEQLTLPQVDAIFSDTLELEYDAAITNWSQLVRIGEWSDAPIEKYGRDELSGTHGFFRSTALAGGVFRDDVTQLPGSAAVIHKIAQDPFAIGYSGVAYRTPGVKAVAIARDPEGPYYSWGTARFFSSDHPLARRVYVYVNRAPGEPLEPALKEFLRFALSLEGQELVLKDGFVPISADVAELELTKLN